MIVEDLSTPETNVDTTAASHSQLLSKFQFLLLTFADEKLLLECPSLATPVFFLIQPFVVDYPIKENQYIQFILT